MMIPQTWNDIAFPAIVEGKKSETLADYLAANQAAVNAALAETGAVLFRGFKVATVAAFDSAVCAYGEPNFPYAESLSNAVRINLTPRVFTANEAPPETSIFLHHEMAQTPIFPSKLFFYCNIAAKTGGATPLCRSDILLDQLSAQYPDLVSEFAAKGVRYTHVMPAEDDAQSGQGRSWRSTLGVTDVAEAKQRLEDLKYEWQWMDDGALRVTSPRLNAIRDLPDGKRSFFNQLIAAYRGWADKRNDPSKSICFGDGSEIAAEKMQVAIQLADDLSFDLEWQSGDVALVDNYRVMHGRRPFTGTRKVLASLIR